MYSGYKNGHIHKLIKQPCLWKKVEKNQMQKSTEPSFGRQNHGVIDNAEWSDRGVKMATLAVKRPRPLCENDHCENFYPLSFRRKVHGQLYSTTVNSLIGNSNRRISSAHLASLLSISARSWEYTIQSFARVVVSFFLFFFFRIDGKKPRVTKNAPSHTFTNPYPDSPLPLRYSGTPQTLDPRGPDASNVNKHRRKREGKKEKE